jgi:hypothetical protein
MDLKTNKQLPATEYERIGEARGGTSQRRLHGKGNQNAKFQERMLVDYQPGDSQTLRTENFMYIRRRRSTPPPPCVQLCERNRFRRWRQGIAKNCKERDEASLTVRLSDFRIQRLNRRITPMRRHLSHASASSLEIPTVA